MINSKDVQNAFTRYDFLELMYQAGFKPSKYLKQHEIDNKKYITIRCSEHEDGEAGKKRASCVVNMDSFTYSCKSCGHHGSLFDVAKMILRTDSFYEAVKYLANQKGIVDTKASNSSFTHYQPIPKKNVQPAIEQIKYFTFDPTKAYKTFTNEELIAGYPSFSDLMKFKAIMTVLIRHSIVETNQVKKIEYLCNERKINPNNPRLKRVGLLPKWKEDKDFWKWFERTFPVADLVRFGLYRPSDAKFAPLTWKYFGEDMIVFPNQDLYSDLYHGAQLRYIVKPEWSPAKEMQLTQTSLVHPIPFAFSREVLMSSEPIFITEGSVDGLSTDKDFAANPGVNTYYKPYLGLFQGKKVFVAYDMDKAGQKATWGYQSVNTYIPRKNKRAVHTFESTILGNQRAKRYIEKLERVKAEFSISTHKGLLEDLKDAGVKASALVWSVALGNDLNELRQKYGALNSDFFQIKNLD